MAKGNVELMEAVGELAALGILATPRGRVAGAELCLVAGGADPGGERRRGALYQREQRLGQGETRTSVFSIQLLIGKEVVHQLLIVAGGQKHLVSAGLGTEGRKKKKKVETREVSWEKEKYNCRKSFFFRPLINVTIQVCF